MIKKLNMLIALQLIHKADNHLQTTMGDKMLSLSHTEIGGSHGFCNAQFEGGPKIWLLPISFE